MMRSIVCGIVVCVTAATSTADTKTSVETKAVACRSCHVGSQAFGPRLVAQRPAYMVAQLTAFKKGDRKNELMQAVTAQLSDEDIQGLAQYWSKQAASDDADTPAATAIQKSPMTFPAGFPTGFTVYHSENDAESKMVVKSYANAAALAAAKANKPLPVGSIIMVVNYAPKLDASGKPTVDASGAWVTGAAKSYSGMESKAGFGTPIPDLIKNGEWAYRLFDGAQKPREVNQARCLACHKPAADKSYVFTLDAMRGTK